MSLGDPIGIGYEAGAAPLSALGGGIQQTAQAFAQRQQEERQKQTQVMGGLLGHMLDKGLVKPNDTFIKTMGKYFGGLGLDVTNPQTATDILNGLDTQKYSKKIKIGANNQVESVEIEQKDLEEEARKEKEEVRKQKELELKQTESQQKQQDIKATSAKQAYQGVPWWQYIMGGKELSEANKIQEQFRQEQLGKGSVKTEIPKGMKVQRNKKTGETRLVPIGE